MLAQSAETRTSKPYVVSEMLACPRNLAPSCAEPGDVPFWWCRSTERCSLLRALNSAVAGGMMAVAVDRSSGRARLCENRPAARTTNDRRDDEPSHAGGDDPRRGYPSRHDLVCRRAADGAGGWSADRRGPWREERAPAGAEERRPGPRRGDAGRDGRAAHPEAHAGKSGRRVVSAFIATAFAQDDAAMARPQWRSVADQLRPKRPKLATLIDNAEPDMLASMRFPAQHRAKLHSTNPLEHFPI